MSSFKININNKNNINGVNIDKFFVRSLLIYLFDKGLSQIEAHEEMTRVYGAEAINKGTVYKWFERFKAGDRDLGDKTRTGAKQKFSNEYLIQLVNDNPDLNMKQLSKLSGTSIATISRRLKQVGDNNTNYQIKKLLKGASKAKSSKDIPSESVVDPTTDRRAEASLDNIHQYTNSDPVNLQYTSFYEKS